MKCKKLILFFVILAQLGLAGRHASAALTIPCDASKIVKTELGNLCADPLPLIEQIIQLILGVVGGVSFLLILWGAGRYLMSRGDPEGIDEAKSIITQAVSGLVLVLLSVFLIRFIGIDVLHIPGLSPFGTGGVSTP